MGLDTWTINEKVKKLQEEVKAELDDLKKNFAVLYDYIKALEDKMPVEKKIKKQTNKSAQA